MTNVMANTVSPAHRCMPTAAAGIPVTPASAKKPIRRTSEMRLEIVMVRRSLDAANAIMAGNNNNRTASTTMIHPDAPSGARPHFRAWALAPGCSVAHATCRATGELQANRLVEVVLHVLERGIQIGADALDHRDDGNRDAGRDQAVFNGRRTLLVIHKMLQHRHRLSPYFR